MFYDAIKKFINKNVYRELELSDVMASPEEIIQSHFDGGLERVHVVVSNISLEDARTKLGTGNTVHIYEMNLDEEKPYHTNLSSWKYAIPVDRNGNEILYLAK